MSKVQLERIESKISRIQHDWQKNNAMISELEVKKRMYENELNELEKKATLMRLKELNSELQAAGLDLNTLDIGDVVQVLKARYHQEHKDITSPEDTHEGEGTEILEDPFRLNKEEV